MRRDLLILAGTSSLALSMALALRGLLIQALAALAAGAYCVRGEARSGLHYPPRRDANVLQFVRNMLKNYAPGKPTLKLVRESSSSGFWFDRLIGSVSSACASAARSTKRFAPLESAGSPALAEVASVLSLRSDGAAHSRARLAAIERRLASSIDLGAKNVPLLAHSTSVSQLGSVIFFPLFAGISMSIMSSIGSFGPANLKASLAIPSIITLYIISSNLSSRVEPLRMGEKSLPAALLSAAVAVMIFRASTALAVNFI